MKYLKKFESFSQDGIDVDHQSYPEINTAIQHSASEYVESHFKNGLNSDVAEICKEIKAKEPKTDEELEKLKEYAVRYFTKNPERMKSTATVQRYPVKSNNIVTLN